MVVATVTLHYPGLTVDVRLRARRNRLNGTTFGRLALPYRRTQVGSN